MSAEHGTYIVYDGSCPFCSQYVKLLRLRESIGPVTLVNAREKHTVVDYVKDQGVDLNNEMALVINGRVYAGADCIHALALMSTNAGAFNALMAKLFASRTVASALYPIMRFGRNLTLRILGRKLISTNSPG
jgi:predicted DCC family thiol-disulfide oxidoreductase YuxK